MHSWLNNNEIDEYITRYRIKYNMKRVELVNKTTLTS